MLVRQRLMLSHGLQIIVLLAVCCAVGGCGSLTGSAPSTGSPVGTPAIGVQPNTPGATGTPAPTLPGWTLLWHDEFAGKTVDPGLWTVVSSQPGGYVGCCLAYGDAGWSPDNVSVSQGQLHIRSIDQPLAGMPYSSGAVSTGQTFSFTYGRIDIRAKLPRTDGLWPAFWLLPVHGDAPGYAPYEIDMLEAWGSNPHQVFAYFHWHDTQVECTFAGPDFSADFHVFTLIWTPDTLQWAVDGVTQCVSSEHVPQQAMYLNLSVAVGGKAQATDSLTRLPQTTDISYVRVWKSA